MNGMDKYRKAIADAMTPSERKHSAEVEYRTALASTDDHINNLTDVLREREYILSLSRDDLQRAIDRRTWLLEKLQEISNS